MIRIFIYLLLALGIGASLAVLLMEDPGYVLISFRSYSIEATLATVILSVLILFFVLFGLVKILGVVNPLKLFRKETWLKIGFRKNVRLQSEKGLQLLLLGRWQDAYKILLETADRAQVPAFNYLAAAYAAFQRRDQLACTYCLSQAKQSSLVATTGIKAFQALLDHQAGREEQSLALLLAIQKEQPDSPYVLALLKQIYLALKDWEKLEALLPSLEKHKVLAHEELLILQEQVAVYRFHRAMENAADYEQLKTMWHELGKPVQKREYVMEAYLRAILSVGHATEAVNLLTKFLRHQWSDRLVELLGYIDNPGAAEQLLLLEGWVRDRPKNVILILTLGRLSLRNQLWGKAREYFESALRFSEDTRLSGEINAELGRLLESLGEREKSLACYHRAMTLMDRKLPDLPLPQLR